MGFYLYVLCVKRAGSTVNFIVLQSRFTYVFDYILTSHYVLPLLKVIELDQRKHNKVVKCSAATMGSLEKVVIFTCIERDMLPTL